MYSTVFVVVVVVVVMLAAAVVNGVPVKCPVDATPMSDFDGSKYNGTWYVVAYSTCTVLMPQVKCQVRNLIPIDSASMKLDTTAVNLKDGGKTFVEGILIADQTYPGKLSLKGTAETHFIVETDYEKYTVIVNNLDYNGVPGSILMITSRQTTIIDADIIRKYRQIVTDAGFDPDHLKIMEQNNCPSSD